MVQPPPTLALCACRSPQLCGGRSEGVLSVFVYPHEPFPTHTHSGMQGGGGSWCITAQRCVNPSSDSMVVKLGSLERNIIGKVLQKRVYDDDDYDDNICIKRALFLRPSEAFSN